MLLHDAGTPPFGHLLEYQLHEKDKWDHESVVTRVLWGGHAPENTAHQIFAGRTIRFGEQVRKVGIEPKLVEDIVRGEHAVSKLLFGSLDLDNLDNVARMCWALGIGCVRDVAERLAARLSVAEDGNLLLPETERDSVTMWCRLRRRAYETIVFDLPTIASQAVLAKCIETLVQLEELTTNEWSLTDEQLLDVLRQHPDTKRAINEEYLGRLPQHVVTIQLEGSLADYGFSRPSEARLGFEELLRRTLDRNILGYLFIDRGTFSRRLRFVDQNRDTRWSTGKDSESLVFSSFLRGTHPVPRARLPATVHEIVDWLRATPEQVRRVLIGTDPEYDVHQTTLAEAATLD